MIRKLVKQVVTGSALGLMLILMGGASLASEDARGTFSIVAADPATGEVGVAVQSKYFCVGEVVPWAKAGVGAVATQAAGVAAYGPKILELLGAGSNPDKALEQALASDTAKDTRQLGVVDASGNVANWTGAKCNAWAGAVKGNGYSCQGNILAGEPVVRGMARAYEETKGTMAERLMAALEAGQAAGGDKRGQQSAAMIVERKGHAKETRDGLDREVDLRVDDHPEPIRELRRLLTMKLRMVEAMRGWAVYESKQYDKGIEIFTASMAKYPTEAEFPYGIACFESLLGRKAPALTNLRKAIELDPKIRDRAKADSDFASLKDDKGFQDLVGK